MASWSKQKELKLKKQKRLFPKSYSADYIPVSRRPGAGHELITQRRESQRSLAFDAKYGEYIVDKFAGVPAGRHEVQQKLNAQPKTPALPDKDKLLSVAMNEFPTAWARIRDVCPHLMNIILENSRVRHVRMFWNEKRNRFILLELSHVGRYMRCSIVYSDGERAKSRFKSNEVRWIEFVSSSPPNPSD